MGLRALEIPTHPRDGISLDALQFAIEHTPVHACAVISNFNNPLGSCMPDENKKELVELLAARDIPLIENDVRGELYFSGQCPTVAKAYDHHLRRIRRVYARYVALLSQAVTRFFPVGTRVTRPSGGFVLWVQLPESVDSLELYKLALRAGITISPGYIFSATHQYRNFIRLNAAFWSDEAERSMGRLGEMIAQLTR